MDMNAYSSSARAYAIYPEQNSLQGLQYAALGLAGEVGEFCNKLKKVLRDNSSLLTPEKRKELAAEVGDVLWYVGAICQELDITLNEIARDNLHKLEERRKADTLKGSGDNR